MAFNDEPKMAREYFAAAGSAVRIISPSKLKAMALLWEVFSSAHSKRESLRCGY